MSDRCATVLSGTLRLICSWKGRENWKGSDMKKAVLALATAATIGFTALAAPSPAEAHWRGGGFGLGLAGGLIGAAVIGGIASSAYAYGPYGYYGGYAPYYGGGYYAPAYYGGYAPAYYGGYYPRYRVIRPAYAYYGGPRYYGARYYGGGHRFHRAYGRW
jgi:hypothetical protein